MNAVRRALVAAAQQLAVTRCATFGHRWEVDPGQTIGLRRYGPYRVCHRCKTIDGEPSEKKSRLFFAHGQRGVRAVIAALYVLIAIAVINVINTAVLWLATLVLACLAVSLLLAFPRRGAS